MVIATPYPCVELARFYLAYSYTSGLVQTAKGLQVVHVWLCCLGPMSQI